MRCPAKILLAFTCALKLACGQLPSPPQRASSIEPVSVLKIGPGTTPPTLLPVDFSSAISDQCERQLHGKVEIAVIVDASGRAQNMVFLKPAENVLDRLAILVAQMDRFTPATHDGAPIAVGQALELKLDGCIVGQQDNSGKRDYSLKLRSAPDQTMKPYGGYPGKVNYATEALPANARSLPPDRFPKVGGNVSPPIPINNPQVDFSEEGHGKNFSGSCMVSLFVDAYGMPHDPLVEHSLDPSMNQKTLEAANRYRFKPAMRNKLEPVPVRIEIEVNVRLTGRDEPF